MTSAFLMFCAGIMLMALGGREATQIFAKSAYLVADAMLEARKGGES